MNEKLKAIFKRQSSEHGSTLPLVIGMGAMMMLASVILIIQSQEGQNIAQGRTNTGNSLAIAEGGVARTLVLLTKPNNAVLLTRNYDLINSKTGKTYLGADGFGNTGDEETAIVQEWTNSCPCPNNLGPPDITYNGNIGTNGQYKLLAYRYNATDKTGTFLVEGKEGTLAAAHIAVKVSVKSSSINFPGVLARKSVDLRGRTVSGANGNVYYNPAFSNNPSLTAAAAPGDPNRLQYLNALWSGPSDNVSGTIFAYPLNPTIPTDPPPGAIDLGLVKESLTISNNTGGIKYYNVEKIDFDTGRTLTVDTTQGPVYIYIEDEIILKGNSKIRNVRSDGQPPRVGDLRLILGQADFDEIFIYDNTCIDTAFIYNATSDVHLFGSGDGCPSNGNSNIDGVVWAEDISDTTTSSTSGINVPDDVSSLSDLLSTTGLNVDAKNQFGGVKSWQRVKL
ncbi:hypothetical protein [Merismopedia glauca]|uniref:Uncharacterized protein n=1 Tax=Merismopedia glauca CCAP 1448/3 TaxID=1296344 RepID=A0A2T1C3T2_9CYAN|nr:hypothetical protein [Merismopedia glauca]PSB02916.1 hypothetical protein C7B64_10720 [Merismopedia glauca CCAP 1448/3]